MLLQLDWMFLREILRQCRFAQLAATDINSELAAFQDSVRRAMQASDSARVANDMSRTWFAIQGLLGAVGNISRILWPPRSEFRGRGLRLRQRLGITDGSSLALRDCRNYFEHFDERLDAWYQALGSRGFADSNIGPSSDFGGMDTTQYLRNYATNTQTIWFGGDRYDLGPVMSEVDRLAVLASQEAETMLHAMLSNSTKP
jgi:hypothetical protein